MIKGLGPKRHRVHAIMTDLRMTQGETVGIWQPRESRGSRALQTTHCPSDSVPSLRWHAGCSFFKVVWWWLFINSCLYSAQGHTGQWYPSMSQDFSWDGATSPSLSLGFLCGLALATVLLNHCVPKVSPKAPWSVNKNRPGKEGQSDRKKECDPKDLSRNTKAGDRYFY